MANIVLTSKIPKINAFPRIFSNKMRIPTCVHIHVKNFFKDLPIIIRKQVADARAVADRHWCSVPHHQRSDQPLRLQLPTICASLWYVDVIFLNMILQFQPHAHMHVQMMAQMMSIQDVGARQAGAPTRSLKPYARAAPIAPQPDPVCNVFFKRESSFAHSTCSPLVCATDCAG